MEFAEVVRGRRMCRDYDPASTVQEEALSRVLELAGRAPSAGHSQGRDFVVLRDPVDRADFWELSAVHRPAAPGDRWLDGMRKAPVLVLCLSDPVRYRERYRRADKQDAGRTSPDWPVPYWDVDTGMAAMLLLLGAQDAGLGSCFFSTVPAAEPALRERFTIPQGHRFVGVVSLGHPAPSGRRGSAESERPSSRPALREPSQYLHNGRFGCPWRPTPP